jgi:hypothetical protein
VITTTQPMFNLLMDQTGFSMRATVTKNPDSKQRGGKYPKLRHISLRLLGKPVQN